MSQLLEIFGRGVQVETADLIWHWLSQAAEALTGSDHTRAQLLNKIIESAPAKNPASLQNRLDEYRLLHPGCHYADLAAAAAALTGNRLTDAFDLLSSVYSRCPNNVTTLYALGHCCERLGREDDAVAFYQDCLKFKNYLQFPRQRLAAIYFKNGQLEKTIREYQLLAAEYPDDLPVLLILGYLYIAAARYKDAIDAFSTAILIQPDNFCPDTDSIDSSIEASNFSDALNEIDIALERYPDRPDLLLRRAAVLASLGQDDQALDYYNHTVAVCPDFLEANIKLGSYLLRLDKPDSAAVQFAHAAKINDRLVDAYLGLGTAQKLAGCTSEALVSLSFAASVETNGPLLLAEAICLQVNPPSDDLVPESQPIGRILNFLSQMLQSHPYNPELHYRFGTLLMSVGRYQQATELFTRALELNPVFSPARNKLTVCLCETDEKALALENLAMPDYIQPETLNLYYRVALLYCDKIKFASSLLNLEQWLNETFSSADTVVNLSLVLRNLGLLDADCSILDNLSQTADSRVN
ncbi:MAG: tetratricopeptide repeat protein [Sedimentisphaerales bacterium]|jgi:tetratricopeptide (TPR) repeat protein